MEPTSVPILPKGVRLHRDEVRNRWVLLAPERTVALDQIGHAILAELDGERNYREIVARLANRFSAPAEQIATDVAEFIAKLADRRFVDIR